MSRPWLRSPILHCSTIKVKSLLSNYIYAEQMKTKGLFSHLKPNFPSLVKSRGAHHQCCRVVTNYFIVTSSNDNTRWDDTPFSISKFTEEQKSFNGWLWFHVDARGFTDPLGPCGPALRSAQGPQPRQSTCVVLALRRRRTIISPLHSTSREHLFLWCWEIPLRTMHLWNKIAPK